MRDIRCQNNPPPSLNSHEPPKVRPARLKSLNMEARVDLDQAHVLPEIKAIMAWEILRMRSSALLAVAQIHRLISASIGSTGSCPSIRVDLEFSKLGLTIALCCVL
jgi:hypothetical protein